MTANDTTYLKARAIPRYLALAAAGAMCLCAAAEPSLAQQAPAATGVETKKRPEGPARARPPEKRASQKERPATPSPPPSATAPATAAQGAQPAPQQPADGKAKHLLQGAWKLHWIDRNSSTQLQVADVFPGDGITNFVGAMAMPDEQACPITGSVVDALQGTFSEGLEQRSLRISAYVIVRGHCKTSQVWIEALGVPDGVILMNGRATIIDAAGKRTYATVGLGR